MRLTLSSLSTLLLGLSFALTACDNEQEPNFQLGGGGTSTQPISKGDAGRIEMPKLTGESNELFITHKTAPTKAYGDSVLNYAYAYDKRYFHSKWVAFRFDDDTRPRTVARKDYKIRPQYPIDPKLPLMYALASDLSFNGYDHGHLCASADRLYSREGNDQTFYMSNMSPQIGNFNQNYWTAFENKVQTLGRDKSFADTLYIVKGGTLNDIDENTLYVATRKMPVPKHYYMALLKVKNGVYTALGFYIEHKDYGVNGTDAHLRQHAVTIRDLEKNTGIDFFHNLPDLVENAVETNLTLSAWRL